MKIFIIMILISFWGISGELEDRLKNHAETLGFGYKTANLIELNKLVNTLKSSIYSFAVPDFIGIPYNNVKSFLITYAQFDLEKEWAHIINKHFLTMKDQNKTIEEGFSEFFLKDCEEYRNKLNNAFMQAQETIIKANISLNQAFSVDNIDSLIAKITQSNERLMVRSTGKEDTIELANAGGNESIANVKPTNNDVLLAIKDVVISYFKEKSLKQRLGLDASLFTPKAFTPVLLQHMIAEKHDSMTKCGVMFTEEVEGGLSRYAKNDQTPIKTSGITIIQAAFGHNEGVVNSLIPVDTYYIDKSKIIYPLIRPKTHRMTLAKSGLKLVINDEALIRKPALDKSAVISLKYLADSLENFYERPMDVEFVINEKESKIYIVQARPLTNNISVENASYLVKPSSLDMKIYQGSAILVGSGTVRICHNKTEVIIAATINEALNIYQNDQEKVPDRKKIQCIIVGKNAPKTSHEATQFRSQNKAVIYLENAKELNNQFPLVVSPQQGIVAIGNDDSINYETMMLNNLIAQGWSNYPIDDVISLHPNFLNISSNELDKIRIYLKEAHVDKLAIKPEWSIWFHTLKTGTKDEAEKTLSIIMRYVNAIINKKVKNLSIDKDDTILTNYLSYIALCAYHIKENLDIRPIDDNYSNRLFPIRILEIMIRQQPKYQSIVDGTSLALILQMFDKEQKLNLHHKDLNSRMIQWLTISSLALNDELKNKWEDFITKLAKSWSINDKAWQRLENMLLNLIDQDALPLWLNTAFADEIKLLNSNDKDVVSIANSLIDEYLNSINFISNISAYLQEIQAINENSALGDEVSFTKNWPKVKNIIANFISDEFINSYKQTNKLGKKIALNIMNKLVDKFDLAIKAVSGSSEITLPVKANYMQTMLIDYAKLLKIWANNLVDINEWMKTVSINQLSHYFTNDYKIGIDDILQHDPSPAMLKPTPHLNVQAFSIGANAGFGQISPHPQSYEDIFSITHQSLLVIISLLGKEAGFNNIPSPSIMLAIESALPKLENIFRESKLSLLGVELNNSKLIKVYNLPLAYHSLQMILSYDKIKNNVSITIKFFGHGGRWVEIADLAWLLNELKLLKAEVVELLPESGVTIEFTIDNKDNITTLINALEHSIDITIVGKEREVKRYDTYFSLSSVDKFSLLPKVLAKYNLSTLLNHDHQLAEDEFQKLVAIDSYNTPEEFRALSGDSKFIIKNAIHSSSKNNNNIGVKIARKIASYYINNYDQYKNDVNILIMIINYIKPYINHENNENTNISSYGLLSKIRHEHHHDTVFKYINDLAITLWQNKVYGAIMLLSLSYTNNKYFLSNLKSTFIKLINYSKNDANEIKKIFDIIKDIYTNDKNNDKIKKDCLDTVKHINKITNNNFTL